MQCVRRAWTNRIGRRWTIRGIALRHSSGGGGAEVLEPYSGLLHAGAGDTGGRGAAADDEGPILADRSRLARAGAGDTGGPWPPVDGQRSQFWMTAVAGWRRGGSCRGW